MDLSGDEVRGGDWFFRIARRSRGCVEIIWVTGLGRAPRAAPHGLVLMFRARTVGIMYKYRLYFTDTLLVCANPLGSVVVRQTEVLPVLETP